MSEVIKNLTNMLGEDKIPDNLKENLNHITNNQNTSSDEPSISPETLSTLMNMFKSSTSQSNDNSTNESTENSSNIDLEMILKLKSIIEKMNNTKNDPRSNLLLSLKPYLNENRQSKVEQYVKLLNMSKIVDVFNTNGGDNSSV